MKEGRRVVVWCWTQGNFGLLKIWNRRLSSFRSSSQQRKSLGLGSLLSYEHSARETTLATSTLSWDRRIKKKTKFQYDSNCWEQKQSATGNSSDRSERVEGVLPEEQRNDVVQVLDVVHQASSSPQSLCFGSLKLIAQKDLALDRRVHAFIARSAFESNSLLAGHIIRMYASHGMLEEAIQVFTKVTSPTTFTWCSIISAHTDHGCPAQALQLYEKMCQSTAEPDSFTYVAVLKACASLADLDFGKQVHTDILGSAVKTDVYVGNCLLDMYAKCARLDDALRVFNNLPNKDVVTWNCMITAYAKHGRLCDARILFDTTPTKNVVTWTAMITGYVHQGMSQEALSLYTSMQQEGMAVANNVTFVSLLQACGKQKDLLRGTQLHSEIRGRGLESDVAVGSCLISMYAKCGCLLRAREVFDNLPIKNVVTWNAMLSGYVQHQCGEAAFTLYALMQEDGMTKPNPFTFSCLLKLCASTGALEEGKDLHVQVQGRGLEANMVVGNSLIDMYAKCGRIQDAQKVFDGLLTRDTVTWTAMIAGYVQHGLGQEALTLYRRMRKEGISDLSDVTFMCLLQACGTVGALHQGKELHSQIRERGLQADVTVNTCLVDMYAKCGKLEDAHNVFVSMPHRSVVTWNSLMNGYAQHCDARRVLELFNEMHEDGVQPDCVTFNCVLVACSRGGLVKEGEKSFKLMVSQGIAPDNYHLTCMVDLYGRAGCLDDAENLLRTSSLQSDIVGWTSLLSACKSHGDLDRAKQCFARIIEMEPANAAAHVMLGRICASAGRWEDVKNLEQMRKDAGALKKLASAYIEVNGKVEMFTLGEDRSDILCKLRSVNLRLKKGGHVPQTDLVLKPLSEQEKEDTLCGHAEKLALAYGLLNTPDGSPLLVTKTLRMCTDCHSGTKILSMIEKREIVVRDAHRVHRFNNGYCSCGDRD